MSLFADDIAVLPLKIGDDGIDVLNRALDRMSAYARKWKITFSAKKTNVVYFKPDYGRSRTLQSYTPPHTHGKLKLTNFPIECTQSYKYLGVSLDQFLTFIPYVRDLIKKLAATSHTISRIVRRGHAPSFPVIQTLVKTVLIPQMVYGFAFIPPEWIQDKPMAIKVTGMAGTTATVNMHKMLKRSIVTPLMRSLGQPYYVHHDSLYVESRLLNIHNLQSLSCARLAHRWMSTHLDATNEAGRMFREHASNPPSHRYHPFTHIKHGIMRIQALDSFRRSPLSVLQVERHNLKSIIWDQQYTAWYTDRTHHPLIRQYTTSQTTQHTLPTYTHMDTPEAASNRARLRFGRARLRYDQKRMKFPNITSTTCSQCNRAEETVQHVLEVCDSPAVVDIRQRMRSKITRLCSRYEEKETDVGYVLNPRAKQTAALKRAYKITGQYINLLREVWDF